MVTEDEEAIQQYGSETQGVFVISFKVLQVVGRQQRCVRAHACAFISQPSTGVNKEGGL